MTPAERLQTDLRDYSDSEHAIVPTDDLSWALARIAALEAVAEAAQERTVDTDCDICGDPVYCASCEAEAEDDLRANIRQAAMGGPDFT